MFQTRTTQFVNSIFLNEKVVLQGFKYYWCTKSIAYHIWYSFDTFEYIKVGIYTQRTRISKIVNILLTLNPTQM